MPLSKITAPLGHGGRRLLLGGVFAVLVLLAVLAVSAQAPTTCPPPNKLAAGACVPACPAGYEDRGRVCVYRSMSR